jgi:hypothetical protein
MKYILFPIIWIVAAVVWVIGRCILCPLGFHPDGLMIRHGHMEKGVVVDTKHEVHCAFCDHVEDKLK